MTGSIQWLVDEDFDADIIRGFYGNIPPSIIVRVQDSGLSGKHDTVLVQMAMSQLGFAVGAARAVADGLLAAVRAVPRTACHAERPIMPCPPDELPAKRLCRYRILGHITRDPTRADRPRGQMLRGTRRRP